MVRGGRTILAGPTGEGKTTMCLWMLRAIIAGEEFLGWRGIGGRALVIDAEQGLRTIHRRMDEMGLGDREDSWYWRIPEGLALDSEEIDVTTLEATIAEIRPDVVLADPLYKLHRGDANDARQAAAVMRHFDDWRARYHFALIVPMHPRKPPNTGGTFTKDEIAGSAAWIWGAEVVLGLRRSEGSASVLHFWKDRDGEIETPAKWLLSYERERGFRRIDEGHHEPSAVALLMKHMSKASPERFTLDALAAMINRETGTTRKALRELERGGYPLRVEPGERNRKLYSVEVASDHLRYEALALRLGEGSEDRDEPEGDP